MVPTIRGVGSGVAVRLPNIINLETAFCLRGWSLTAFTPAQ